MSKILNEIALDVYNSGWLETECKKICKDEYLREELFQEIMLIILTFKPAGQLQAAYVKGQHLPFIKKIIMNQFNSKTSPFYTKYKKYATAELNEEITEDNNETED